MNKKFAIGLLVIINPILMGADCNGDKGTQSGIRVKPGALCEHEGSEGTYDRVWYVCKKQRDGDLRWQKEDKH